MTIMDPKSTTNGFVPVTVGNSIRCGTEPRKLHRIATVRRQQGISLRSIARQTRIDTRELGQQENESNDLRLSELYRWEQVLGVPVCELLVDSGNDLSRPIMERARLVRIMKTVKSLVETANSNGVRRLAETLVEQLVEIMPELKDVAPWHTVGQRRSLTEYGRAAERVFSVDLHDDDPLWDT